MKNARWIATSVTIFMAVISFTNHLPSPKLITFDVYGYYVYLPAAITYGDLGEFDFVQDHFSSYDLGSGPYQVMKSGIKRIPIYTMGLSLLIAPFYLCADLIALIVGLPRDGLSQVYQVFFMIGSIFYCWIGFYFLARWLTSYFENTIVWMIALSIAVGTNYLVYVAYDLGLTHAYIFSMYCMLLFFSQRWVEKGDLRSALAIGFLIGILCLIRPTEIISAFIPVGLQIQKAGLKKFIRKYYRHMVLMVFIGIGLILPQLVLWKLNTGQWIFNAYMEQGHQFHFNRPHLLQGLFSYRKGWFIYTPLMLGSFFGFYWLYKKSRSWFWVILVFTVFHIYITFSWSMWWYASSFGSRPMVHAYAALALPLGFIIHAFKRRWYAITIWILLILLNLTQSWQYIKKIIPGDGINRVFYWKSFCKMNQDPSLIKYVDLDAYLPKLGKYSMIGLDSLTWPIAQSQNTLNRIIEIQGVTAQEITPKQQFGSPITYQLNEADVTGIFDPSWFFVEAELFRKGDAYNAYNAAQLGISFHQDGKKIHEDGIRFPFHLPEDIWAKTGFEIQAPEGFRKGDMIKVFIWNPSPDTIYVHKLNLKRIAK